MQKGYAETITLQDLYNLAIIESGQFIAGDVFYAEFPIDKFRMLFKHKVYPLYSKYVFKTIRQNLSVMANMPYVFPDPAPDIVSRVVPVSIYGVYIGEFMNFRFMSHTSFMSTKPLGKFTIVWRYEKPKLFVGYQGNVEVECQYKYAYDDVTDIVEVNVDSKDILIDLCVAEMLISVGRARRLVKVADTNLEFDAEALVQEGTEMLTATKEKLLQYADLSALNF